MIATIAVLGLLVLACAVYGAYTARADRRYMAWASDETDWRKRRDASEVTPMPSEKSTVNGRPVLSLPGSKRGRT